MFFVFGWGDKIIREAYCGIHYCPNCKSFHHFYLNSVYSQASLFFLPILRFHKHSGIFCENCRNGKPVEKDELPALIEKYQNHISPAQMNEVFHYLNLHAEKLDYSEENVEMLIERTSLQFSAFIHQIDAQELRLLISNLLKVMENKRLQPTLTPTF